MNGLSVTENIIMRKVLNRKEVMDILRLKTASSFNNFRKKETSFPRPIKIGLRRIGWFEDEIGEWLTKPNSRCEF